MALRDWVYQGAPEVFRCQRDGRLVTDRMIRRGTCPGHHLRAPVSLTWLEWIGIWLRLIR